jgi:ABC-type hemin transport system ATPase subunit
MTDHHLVLLRARGVSKRFGGVLALSHVDLEVRAGEILGLIGQNGAAHVIQTGLQDLGGVHSRPPDPTGTKTGKCRRVAAPMAAHLSPSQSLPSR